MIQFGSDVLGDLEQALEKEWLETNGIGGFASSTIVGLNIRRYHGLLIAATHPPAGRSLLLSKFEETLIVGGRRYDLSANQYPGAIYPQGHQWLTSFRLDPFPIFTWEIEGLRIEKSLFLVHGENTAVVSYRLSALSDNEAQCRIEIRPLIAFRDFHGTTHENAAIQGEATIDDSIVTIRPYDDLPRLHFTHNAHTAVIKGEWYRNFEYRVERERGLDYREDLYNPFELQFDLNDASTASIIVSTKDHKIEEADDLRKQESDRRERLCNHTTSKQEPIPTLLRAADQFIVSRGELNSIIAGYPWFADWGRDTMIALPGLTIATKRFDLARSILLEFSRHLDQGMLPNRFPDAGETPEYNTVDATLWYFEAARAYAAATDDTNFIRKHLYEKFIEIIDWHVRGTRYRIHLDDDGLLFAGEPGVQLTWMDAKVGDWVVTPRIGKPVEIQALWFNALCILAQWAFELGDLKNEVRFRELALTAKASFNRDFWNDETGMLYDVIDGQIKDSSIRPNQIFAISLPYSMLNAERARSVLHNVEKELLTPYGLRSLSASDPNYIGHYEGGVRERDGAYHQGTVWSWLIGPFLSAHLRVHGPGVLTQENSMRYLAPLLEHLSTAGLGQISEIFDGDPPYRPRGCIAQAWSIAEMLRSLDLLGKLNSSG